jgi:hypothetical protein
MKTAPQFVVTSIFLAGELALGAVTLGSFVFYTPDRILSRQSLGGRKPFDPE